MLKVLFIIIVVIIVCSFLYIRKQTKKQQNLKETFLLNNSWKLKPLSKKEAIYEFHKLLSHKYVKGFSIYDIQSKTNSIDSRSIEDYIKYSIKQIQEWTNEEKQLLNNFYNQFMNKLKELNMLQQFSILPPTINVIKSTMKHEGNALGYTINNNIVLKELNYSLLAHELFHIFSRNNFSIRKYMYGILGFKIAHSLILPPKNIKELIISNPDTPQIVFTNIIYKDHMHYVTPILHSKKRYNEYTKSFFDDMKVSLLFVNTRVYNDEVILVYKDMREYGIDNHMIPIEDSLEYQQKLGNNTTYNIHPEEVSAKHFEFIIGDTWKTKKNPKLIKKLITLLTS